MRAYDKIDGITMGLPLAPNLANLWVAMKIIGLKNLRGRGDHVIEDTLTMYFDYLNKKHPNIKCIKEVNNNCKLLH